MSTTTGFKIVAPQSSRGWWWRIITPFLARLQTIVSSGLTPQKLAQTLCIGVALGTLPLLWGTSLLCILLAHTLRLNHIALQSVNYLLYPLQLALLIPFFKLGAWMFPGGPTLPTHMFTTLIHKPISSLPALGWITLTSVAAWLVTVFPIVLIVYGVLLAIASRKVVRTRSL